MLTVGVGLIKLRDISKGFDGVKVLDGVSAALPERGLVCVLGPSGVGKTTLLRIIAGLEPPDAGAVEGRPNRIAMQFEDDHLFPWMTAAANIELVGASPAEASARLAELGLEGREHARISDLSGGQRRRVALARALAFPAPCTLLDEPTARLDPESAACVLQAIQARAADSLVIAATHDPVLASAATQAIELQQIPASPYVIPSERTPPAVIPSEGRRP